MLRFHRINLFYWLRCKTWKSTHHSSRRPNRRSNILNSSATFVSPTWRFRSQIFQHSPVANIISRRLGRTFIYLFGLALSLFSLGAVHILQWVKSQEVKREVKLKDWNCAPLMQNMKKMTPDHIGSPGSNHIGLSPVSQLFRVRISELPKVETSSLNRWLKPAFSVELDGSRVVVPMRATVEAVGVQLSTIFRGLIDTGSPFTWTNGLLNCSHFHGGFSQMCLTCWLNAVDGWVFGPCLLIQDATFHLLIGNLGVNKTSIRTDCSLCSDIPSHSLGLHDILNFLSTSDRANQYSVHRTNLEASVLHKSNFDSLFFKPCEPLLSLTRSAGDGAPSAGEIPLRDQVHSKSSKDFEDVAFFYPNRSNFPDLSGPNGPFSNPPGFGGDAAITSQWNTVNLQSSCPAPFPPSTQYPLLNDSFHLQQTGEPTRYHIHTDLHYCASADSSSSNLLDNDELEYDDFGQNYFSLFVSDFDQVDPTEQSQLAVVLDALNPLLSAKPEGFYEDSQHFIASDKGKHVEQDREKLNEKFAELAQTATALSDDLLDLETVLHQIDYRTKAAQIALDQAEDNLDYVWYLRENLEGSSMGSSRQTSCASDMSLLGELAPSTFSKDNSTCTCSSPPPERCIPLTAYPGSVQPESTPVDEIPDSVLQLNPLSHTISSCMTSSMPASAFSRAESYTQSQNVRWRDRNLAARRYIKKHRRTTIPSFTFDLSHTAEEDGHTVKSDDFQYPELTFDNDGIVDWMGTTVTTPGDCAPGAIHLDR